MKIKTQDLIVFIEQDLIRQDSRDVRTRLSQFLEQSRMKPDDDS
jgi:hypothetical protein